VHLRMVPVVVASRVAACAGDGDGRVTTGLTRCPELSSFGHGHTRTHLPHPRPCLDTRTLLSGLTRPAWLDCLFVCTRAHSPHPPPWPHTASELMARCFRTRTLTHSPPSPPWAGCATCDVVSVYANNYNCRFLEVANIKLGLSVQEGTREGNVPAIISAHLW